MDAGTAYSLIVTLASTGVFIASVELLALKSEFEDGGLFGWEVLRTVSRATLYVGSGRPRQLISHPFFVPTVAGARALAALTLILFRNHHALSTACVLAVITATILMYWRAPFGLDGSDQMFLITFVAVGIHKLFSADVHIGQASLWFIAIQGCLSYCVAGVAKVISPVWRSGEAVRRIMGTRTYGTSRSASFVSGRAGTCLALSWLLMLFECTFPLALAFGETGFAVFAVMGIFFHIANAAIMGLNTFVWAFVATYPAILFCAVSIRH
uniref:HTTM domain-containing protein n=1 Tax=Solibacter usitatus (strain Ellin6076) TaxID=234267 RepID=Q022R4_SOLUE